MIPSVHPRGHGEHTTAMVENHGGNGSSPWARGTHCRVVQLRILNRFIPVGTGNTVLPDLPALTHAVHPRGHGEHSITLLMSSTGSGSSPWARGTR